MNLAGRKFNRLLVLYQTGINKNQRSMWRCQCDCGQSKDLTYSSIVRGTTKSCGCFRREVTAATGRRTGTKHGHKCGGKRTPTYISYEGAKQRCNNRHCKDYPRYGGRGIKFLFVSINELILEIGERPPGLTLDRINNFGHYEAGNVRWATLKEQANNRRSRLSS